ncbi:MAG TPA: alpha/beta fold hydrolase [Fimbriimonas sp.]
MAAEHRLNAAECAVPLNGESFFCRQVGRGPEAFVLHGGPDFDHSYLVPGMDLLADEFRLSYYDQRGRGRSTGAAESVSLASEVEDLDAIRRHFGLDRLDLLGHSWGAILALEYALRHPDRVSRLILMNPAPVTSGDMARTRELRSSRLADQRRELDAISQSPAFAAGDPAVVSRYYKRVFVAGLKNPDHLRRLDWEFTHFTPSGLRRARAIEERLFAETFSRHDFDMSGRLTGIRAPALVVHGDHDFVPVDCARRIAAAIPGARIVVLPECGHFAFVEQPEETHREVSRFLGSSKGVVDER